MEGTEVDNGEDAINLNDDGMIVFIIKGNNVDYVVMDADEFIQKAEEECQFYMFYLFNSEK